jgi:dTDP-4-amino-4,6-dideoxygalactose transaminase
MRVARYDYDSQFVDLEATTRAVEALLRDGDYVLGRPVRRFEQRFAGYVGVRHAIGVNSGTDALVLALRALEIGPGDEVITVANTFYATVVAITAVGATPRLVDCHPDDHLMDLDQVEAAIGPRTRAVLAVHLFGKPLPMTSLRQLADRHSLALVEDCAQAVGATWDGRRVGSFGDVGCFSFHPSKNLAAAGDAGAATTDREDVAERLRILRNLGQRSQNEHVLRGANSKLDSVQAIVLDYKLDQLDQWNEQRRAVAGTYTNALAPLPVRTPRAPDPEHVFHLYQVDLDDRDRVLQELRRSGIDAVVRYPVPIHRQPAFADLALGNHFPNAERQAGHTLCLPIRPNLTQAECGSVVDALRSAVGRDRVPATG